jgi:hypothetical protein
MVLSVLKLIGHHDHPNWMLLIRGWSDDDVDVDDDTHHWKMMLLWRRPMQQQQQQQQPLPHSDVVVMHHTVWMIPVVSPLRYHMLS